MWRSNVFVSHAYSYDLEDSIEAMLRYEETHPGSAYIFDPFSLNQNSPGTVQTSVLIAGFGDRIEEYEKVRVRLFGGLIFT